MTKLVVVTGANRGIGLAISKQLLTKTADTNVVLAGRDEAGLQAAKESIVKECKVAESRMKVVRMDVADDASVAAAYKQVRHTSRFVHVTPPLPFLTTTVVSENQSFVGAAPS
eukprot:GHVU01070019.1.p2 GENE.GHVU01070019.1~~GHVU01070019.1.p2  ORF type:complete len:113 (-),score=13.15 GHVU01070019.1:546-884(-)